jgi:phospholipid-binding lipoprotein MlaA
MQTLRTGVTALAAAATLAGCATVKTPTKGDPLEGLNRTIFTFNNKVDRYALKPVAQGYVKITPQPVRESVTNFFSNIGDLYVAANNLLQLKITDGVEDIMRIAINTTFGVGGLFDVATLAKLPKHDNDLGLTLGHYGVPAGPYLVLPFFGPSTVRDATGSLGAYFVNPLSYVRPDGLSWALYGVNLVNTRANLLGATNLLAGAALDPYSFVRNAYLQRRQYLLSEGKSSSAALPDYGEPLPNYGNPEQGSEAAAPGGASSPASAAPQPGASAPTAASGAPVPASGAAQSTPAGGANGASGTSEVPGDRFVPPRVNFPSLRLP